MSILPTPDANDIGRYASTTGIPANSTTGFATLLNYAVDDISTAISRMKAANSDHVAGTPALATGWNTPSQHVLRRRNGWVSYRFNAARTASLAADGTVATIPAGFRTDTVTWLVGYLVGTTTPLLLWYDPAVHQIRCRNTLASGNSITLMATWEAVS